MSESGDNPKVFVLKRELSEVHLLLDNISSNPENRLPLSQADVPEGLDEDWLMQVCQIDWPTGPQEDKAADACLLIKVKDFLNTLAKPASGATIAFTLLVTQEGARARRRAEGGESAAPSRGSMASAAYPDLMLKARRFRTMVMILSAFLFAWLITTCILSWSVAFGNTGIAQLSTAQTMYDKTVLAVEATQLPVAGEKDGQGSARNSTLSPTAAQVVVRPAAVLCKKARDDLASTATPAPIAYVSIAQLQACEALERAAQTRDEARAALRQWLHPIWPDSYEAKHPDADYLALATSRVSILGNGVLPFFFGMLGAGAAIVRSLSRKMKMSLLTPRDLNLSLQQLALGAVTGACIGLFVAQPGASMPPGTTLGPVALSGSALSFVAGFGVDAVFATIEGIIVRIFNITPPPGSVGDPNATTAKGAAK